MPCWIYTGIAIKPTGPPCLEGSPFGLVACLSKRVCVIHSSGLALVVYQGDAGCPEDFQSVRTYLQAEVDVAIRDWKGDVVEAANRFEVAAIDCQERPCDCADSPCGL